MEIPPNLMSKREIRWQEEQKELTLTGEPVLTLTLSRPQLRGPGPLPRAANRYYEHLSQHWLRHWSRETYLSACCTLALQRERSKPFTPWSAALSGQVTLLDEQYLSLSLTVREDQGEGPPLEYRWGDVWSWRTGAPVPLGDFFPNVRNWRGGLRQALTQAVPEQVGADPLPSPALRSALRRWFPSRRFALTQEGMEFYFPQCTLAPAEQGAPAVLLPQSALPHPNKKA